jgi:formyltetrahydrofolate deformylase
LNSKADVGRLIVSCPDRHGIIAAISGALAEAGANIVTFDQHSTNP